LPIQLAGLFVIVAGNLISQITAAAVDHYPEMVVVSLLDLNEVVTAA
jgi:hypothetical protein